MRPPVNHSVNRGVPHAQEPPPVSDKCTRSTPPSFGHDLGNGALFDRLFEQAAARSLGFARRHLPFFPSLGEQGIFTARTLWLLWRQDELAGYAIGSQSKSVLQIDNLLLLDGEDDAPLGRAVEFS